jgi:splicing factor U2AF subunit
MGVRGFELMKIDIYARFKAEEDAQKAVADLNNRFYAGVPVWAELSPVTDFREACCRQFETGECGRAGFCNFMHLKKPSRHVKREMFERQELSVKMLKKDRRRSRSRDRSRERRRRSRSRERGHRHYERRHRY